ncbi:MAG: hypothetical protein RugAbin2_00342 [Rugosibacter sp.]|nr:hypothetical protein [Rugosibacter sp.]
MTRNGYFFWLVSGAVVDVVDYCRQALLPPLSLYFLYCILLTCLKIISLS